MQLPFNIHMDLKEIKDTNLHTFDINSWTDKLLHQQHSFTVAACYGTADFNVVSLGLCYGKEKKHPTSFKLHNSLCLPRF